MGQTITEQLVSWSEGVQDELKTPVQLDSLDLSGMGWIKLLWGWIIPPQHGYRVRGVLTGTQSRTLSVVGGAVQPRREPGGRQPDIRGGRRHSGRGVPRAGDRRHVLARDPGGQKAIPGLLPGPARAPVPAGVAKSPTPEDAVTAAPARSPGQNVSRALEILGQLRRQLERREIGAAQALAPLAEAQECVTALPTDWSFRPRSTKLAG